MLMLSHSFIFAQDFGYKDLDEIYKSAQSAKFIRHYKNKRISIEIKVNYFSKMPKLIFFVGKNDKGYVSCAVYNENNIYDYIRVGDYILMEGEMSAVSYINGEPSLNLIEICSIYKVL